MSVEKKRRPCFAYIFTRLSELLVDFSAFRSDAGQNKSRHVRQRFDFNSSRVKVHKRPQNRKTCFGVPGDELGHVGSPSHEFASKNVKRVGVFLCWAD